LERKLLQQEGKMNEIKIAFFDTKPYDKKSFEFENANFKYSLSFFEAKLTAQTVSLTRGCDVVCAFVNDTLNAEVLRDLSENGVKLIAMRCAGYNNVD
jgi:D-lactate dehydrogenase